MTIRPSEWTASTWRLKSKNISFCVAIAETWPLNSVGGSILTGRISLYWSRFHSWLHKSFSINEHQQHYNKCSARFSSSNTFRTHSWSLTARRVHRSSRSLSRQTWNIKPVYEVESPTWKTRRTQNCAATYCVETSRHIASPVWLLRSVRLPL